MKFALAFLIVVHGLIHLMGFAKAFEFAKLEALRQPISRAAGGLWLLASLLFLTAGGLLLASRTWGWVALAAVLLSQVLILQVWSDGKYGTWANLAILLALILALLNLRGSSLVATYRRDVAQGMALGRATGNVAEADLASLPPALQTYLRRVGVVGKPRVNHFRVRFTGQLRNGHDGPWMNIQAEQVTFLDPPARLFLVTGSRTGISFQALHRFVGPAASMQVRLASLFEVVNASGPEMDQSETVTFFNDLCVLAPAALLEVPVRWEQTGTRTVIGHYTQAGRTVSATLTFTAEGDLAGFSSQDRFQTEDGKRYLRLPWSTPVGDYQPLGGLRLPRSGEAVWPEPGGDFVYAKFKVKTLAINAPAGR